MRSADFGAKSGRSTMVTVPYFSSISTVLAGSAAAVWLIRISITTGVAAAACSSVRRFSIGVSYFVNFDRVRWRVSSGTKEEMSPPSAAMSFTNRDEMN